MASQYGNAVHASNGARRAVLEAFGTDLLESHKVMKSNKGIIDDADLILVMEESLIGNLPPHKTWLITEFFGRSGDVANPWPDYNTTAPARYRSCLAELRSLI